jgi:hypothetical protein
MENLACELASGKDWMVGVRTVSDGTLTEESDFVFWVFVTLHWRLYVRARSDSFAIEACCLSTASVPRTGSSCFDTTSPILVQLAIIQHRSQTWFPTKLAFMQIALT